jgi:hypothetical protein
VAESLWATIKRELTDGEHWATRHELNAALFEYIEVFYNRERLHSFLDNCTPKEYDDHYRMSQDNRLGTVHELFALGWCEVVVPIGVPVVAGEGQAGEFGVGDFDTGRVVALVPFGEDP